MKPGKRLYLFAAAMFILSIGGKLILERPVNYAVAREQLIEATPKKLEAVGFSTSKLTQSAFLLVKDGCMFVLEPSYSNDSGEAAFLQNFGSLGRLQYWYNGTYYDNHPGYMLIFDRYIERTKMLVGLKQHIWPVFQIVASGGCTNIDMGSLSGALSH